ncbi:MAG: ATP synthase F1 subunit delta [Bacteroidota bacterium]
MSVTRIANRYAKSLMDLAIERGELDVVLKDVEDFKKVSENRDFELLLKSPIVNTDKKQDIFNALFSERYNKTTKAFLDILLRKSRESYLTEIADSFIAQYKNLQRISSITLTTASSLSEEKIGSIKSKLLASPATMDNVDIQVKVDPELIGGFVIEFDDKLYDSSVAHKLSQLRKEFSDNEYVAKM